MNKVPDMPAIESTLALSRVLGVTEGAIRRAEADGRICRGPCGWDVVRVVAVAEQNEAQQRPSRPAR